MPKIGELMGIDPHRIIPIGYRAREDREAKLMNALQADPQKTWTTEQLRMIMNYTSLPPVYGILKRLETEGVVTKHRAGKGFRYRLKLAAEAERAEFARKAEEEALEIEERKKRDYRNSLMFVKLFKDICIEYMMKQDLDNGAGLKYIKDLINHVESEEHGRNKSRSSENQTEVIG